MAEPVFREAVLSSHGRLAGQRCFNSRLELKCFMGVKANLPALGPLALESHIK